jgi:hypothetical protein
MRVEIYEGENYSVWGLCNSYSLPDEEELTDGHEGSIQDSSRNV